MRLNDIKPNPGSKHRRKRLGSGESSGLGKTCGKGHKGQKSRSGGGVRLGFEGGQMPIYRRLPKKGFNNARFSTNHAVVNVGVLEERFDDGSVIDEAALRDAGLVKGRWDGIKVLGSGSVSKKFTVQVDEVSASAREKIEKAGGSCPPAAEKAPEKTAPAKKPAPATKAEAAPPAEEPAPPAAEAEAAPEAEPPADVPGEEPEA